MKHAPLKNGAIHESALVRFEQAALWAVRADSHGFGDARLGTWESDVTATSKLLCAVPVSGVDGSLCDRF